MVNNVRQPARPDMQTVLDALKRLVKFEMNCVQIGIIQSFDISTQLATIAIAMKQVVSVNEDGIEAFQEYPLLIDCPVMTLFGGNSFISMPITPGDTCIVLFNDRDIDQWVTKGNGNYPTTARLHDISDAIAIVGIRNLVNPIPNILGGGIRIYYNENTSIDLTDDGVTINAENLIVNGNLNVNGILSTDYAGKQISYNTHTHNGVMSGASNTGEPNDI